MSSLEHIFDDSRMFIDSLSVDVTSANASKNYSFVKESPNTLNLSPHDDKPYSCNTCLRRFKQQDKLTKHMINHEIQLKQNQRVKDKAFECPHPGCGKAYITANYLEHHILSIHHGMSMMEDIPTHSNDNHRPTFQPAKPGGGAGNMVLAVRALEVPCPILTKMVSRCLHDGCSHTFDNGLQLRAHLFAHAPGLMEEMKAMREHMFNLISIMETWDVKSGADQQKMLDYVETIKAVILANMALMSGGQYCLTVVNHSQSSTRLNNKDKIFPASSRTSSISSTQTVTDVQHHAAAYNKHPITNITAEDERQLIDAILDSDFIDSNDRMDCETDPSATPRTYPLMTDYLPTNADIITTEHAIAVASSLQPSSYEQSPIISPNKGILNGWMKHLIRVPVRATAPNPAYDATSQAKDHDIGASEMDHGDDRKDDTDSGLDSTPKKRTKRVLRLGVLKRAFGFK